MSRKFVVLLQYLTLIFRILCNRCIVLFPTGTGTSEVEQLTRWKVLPLRLLTSLVKVPVKMNMVREREREKDKQIKLSHSTWGCQQKPSQIAFCHIRSERSRHQMTSTWASPNTTEPGMCTEGDVPFLLSWLP